MRTGSYRRTLGLSVCLIVLVGWSALLAWLSGAFAYERPVLDKPILTFVVIQIIAGVVYLLTLWLLKASRPSHVLFLSVFVVGIIMRLSQFAATPILENDAYRYLWDGAVTAHGLNPYVYAPSRVTSDAAALPRPWRDLADHSGHVLQRINHPTLRTIYPPTAEAAFTVAYWIAPFNIQGLRWTWLGLDLLNAFLLLAILGRSTSRLWRFSIYWLNPLLIKEVFNSAHMEPILLVTMLAALVAVVRYRAVLGGFLLAVAAGAKIWPILWLPLFIRHLRVKQWKRLLALGVFAAAGGLLALPMLLGHLDHAGSSGLVNYAERWQLNDAAYFLLDLPLKWLNPAHDQIIARGLVCLGLVATIIVLLRQRHRGRKWLFESVLVVTGVLFMFSPTQFPWYYLWLLPLLALRPMWSLLALTVTLPLYYLRFPLAAMGHAAWFDDQLVWLEFVPIWLLLAWEAWRRSCDAASNQSRLPVTATSGHVESEAKA